MSDQQKDYAWLEGWWRVPESAFALAQQMMEKE